MIQLDSDVIIDIGRGYEPALRWLHNLPANGEFAVSGFTVMEIIQGSRNASEQWHSLRTLARFSILWLRPSESEKALSLFNSYRLSHGVGILDILIGCTALTYNLPIATFNRKHFAFLPGIQLFARYDRS